MDGQFLWLPEPGRYVVLNGKPVIDCNPKVSKIKFSVERQVTLTYPTEHSGCPVNMDEHAEESELYISAHGSAAKVTDYDMAADQEFVEPYEKFIDGISNFHPISAGVASCGVSAELTCASLVSVENSTFFWTEFYIPEFITCTCSGGEPYDCLTWQDVYKDDLITIDITNLSENPVDVTMDISKDQNSETITYNIDGNGSESYTFDPGDEWAPGVTFTFKFKPIERTNS